MTRAFDRVFCFSKECTVSFFFFFFLTGTRQPARLRSTRTAYIVRDNAPPPNAMCSYMSNYAPNSCAIFARSFFFSFFFFFSAPREFSTDARDPRRKRRRRRGSRWFGKGNNEETRRGENWQAEVKTGEGSCSFHRPPFFLFSFAIQRVHPVTDFPPGNKRKKGVRTSRKTYETRFFAG